MSHKLTYIFIEAVLLQKIIHTVLANKNISNSKIHIYVYAHVKNKVHIVSQKTTKNVKII